MKPLLSMILIMLFAVSCANAYASSVISWGKPVTANGQYSSYAPGNLTDGSEGSFGNVWLFGGYSGWAQVDLENIQIIEKVIWYPSVAPSTNQTFSLYIDGNLIETITQYVPAAAPGSVEFDIAPTAGRYVKMEIYNSASWISGVEFEIYGAEKSPVPEPLTLVLLGLGIAGLIRRRIKK
ncbi:MAG: PEP-CTERM sorting domain-containing protein [Candidatus Auribacterota bacterium]